MPQMAGADSFFMDCNEMDKIINKLVYPHQAEAECNISD